LVKWYADFEKDVDREVGSNGGVVSIMGVKLEKVE